MEAETASVPGYWGLAPIRTVILGKFSLAPPFPLKGPHMDNNDTVTLSIDTSGPGQQEEAISRLRLGNRHHEELSGRGERETVVVVEGKREKGDKVQCLGCL